MRNNHSSIRRARRIRFETLEPRNMLAYLPGDFNVSGVVDNTDYNEWRANFGRTAPELPADGNSDGTVDAADYVVWRKNLGKTLADVAPDAPRGVEARATGATSVEVTWQAAAQTTSYAVQRRQPGTETEFTTIAPSVGTTSYTDSTATANTLYEYRIVAQNTNGSSPASQSAEATANQSSLTAYRPQGVHTAQNPTGPIYDNPHPKTPVSEEDENSNTEGPGIRINADDDNENGISDRAEMGSAVSKENDLIEVKIDRLPGAGNLVLSAGSSLQLWLHHDRTGPIESGEPLNFVNNSSRVFVEWVDSDHGTDGISLIDQTTQTTLDSLQFHSFRSMVVIFGGNGQNPQDTDNDGKLGDPVKGGPNREGIFDFASELYVTGWDVYAYNEEVDLEIPKAEVVNAVDRRFVRPDLEFFMGGGISIMGHSQGGGATHDLIEMLTSHYAEVQEVFSTMLGVYLDAVERQIFPLNDPIPQTDYPDTTVYLLNIFQRSPFPNVFVGNYIDEDEAPPGTTVEDVDLGSTLTHTEIDDDLQVKQRIRTRLQQRLINR